jgi:uncharacterized protein DUF2630
MDDKSLLDHIHELVAEEKRLRAADHDVTDDDRARLTSLERELDQTWDLLRQRRAREEFDEDPSAATERKSGDVESYLQ